MAKKRKSFFEGAKDVIEQGLISARSLAAFVRNTSRDKRTVKSTQRAAETLQGDRTDSQVAESLGMNRQRWTALKKQIKEGKAYSPELRDILKEATPQEATPVADSRGKQITREKIAEPQDTPEPESIVNPERLKDGVYLFDSLERLQSTGTHIDLIKTFPTKKQALSWWRRIVQSGKYVAIAKDGQGFYAVVGLGKRDQRPSSRIKKYKNGRSRKVQVIEDKNGENRVTALIAKYKDTSTKGKRGKK